MRALFAYSLLASLTFTTVAPTAFAAEPAGKIDVIGRVPVPFTDLNLRNEADARAMLERLEKAAYRACGGDPRQHSSYRTMPTRVTEVYKECRELAVARAVAEINVPTLTAAAASAARREPRC